MANDNSNSNQSFGINFLIEEILQDEFGSSIIPSTSGRNNNPNDIIKTNFDFVNSSTLSENSSAAPVVLFDFEPTQPNVDPLLWSQEPSSRLPNDTMDCTCKIYQCEDKLVHFRDLHKLAMQRKNYCLRRQQKVIQHYETQLGMKHPDPKAIDTSQILLPYDLPATQRAMLILNEKQCWRTMYEMTYVIREDLKEEDYKTACYCSRHQCQRKFRMLKNSQAKTAQHKNQKIVRNEKLLEFYESKY